MGTPELIIVLVGSAIVIGLLVLAVNFVVKLVGRAILGAIKLLGFASEQGFIGVAAYIACWVFMLPVMIVLSVVVGFFVPINDDPEKTIYHVQRSQTELEARWEAEDRLYEEARQKRLGVAQAKTSPRP